MKHAIRILIIGILTSQSLLSQIIIFQDDFESYNPSQKIAIQSTDWITWSGTPGGNDDAYVSNQYYSSPSYSMNIVNGSDMVYKFGEKTNGHYIIEFKMLMKPNFGGYLNVNHESYSNGAFELIFDDYNNIIYDNGIFDTIGTYQHGQWQNIIIDINLDKDTIVLSINGIIKGSTFSLSGSGIPMNKLSSIDFYGINSYYNITNSSYFIDDFKYTKMPSVGKNIISSSANPYTAFGAEQTCLDFNNDLDLLTFTHRANPSAGLSTSSGHIVVSKSTDGGANWSQIILTSDTAANRYPSGVIYNPPSNTNPNNAYIVAVGPTASTTWTHNFFASAKLDGSSFSTNYVPSTNQYMVRTGLTSNANRFNVVSWEFSNNKYIAHSYNGIWNSTSNNVNWNDVTFQHSFHQNIFGDINTAWSSDGSIGYIYYRAIDSLNNNTPPQPIVYKTTNYGATWTMIPFYNFANLSAITNAIWSTKNGVKKPYFRNSDAVVDSLGQLHIVAIVQGGFSSHTDSLNYLYTSEPGKIMDVYLTSTGWNALVIDSLKTLSYSWNGILFDNRLQVSKNSAGTKIFAVWADSDPMYTNNQAPNLFACGWDINNSCKRTPVVNFTSNTSFNGNNFLHYVAQNTKEINNQYIIPVTTTDIGANDNAPVVHKYVSGIEFNESDFYPNQISPLGPIEICGTQIDPLKVNNCFGYNFQWMINNVNISGANNSTYNPTQSGMYSVVSTSASCSFTSNSVLVTLKPLPPATITASGPTSICDGLSVTLNASAGNGLTYQWKKNGNDIIGANGISFVASQMGNYSVIVTDTTGTYDCSIESNSIAITVIPTNYNIVFAANPTYIATQPFFTVFYNQTQNTSNYTWKWLFGDGSSSNLMTPTHTYASNGIYTVTSIATDILTGCSDTLIKPGMITCNSGLPCPVIAEIYPAGPFTICANDSFLLHSVSHNPNYTYQWFYNGVQISNATDSLLWAYKPGIYKLRVSDTCSKYSEDFELNKYAPNNPIIMSNGLLQPCSNDSMELYVTTTYNSYLWSTGQTSQNIYVKNSGNYTVTVTDAISCNHYSTPFTVNASLLPIPEICIVGVDSATNKNRIIWQRETNPLIDSFRIYRETSVANQYQLIGSKGFNDQSLFIDQNSNPIQQAYRYKITAVDTCGAETPMSNYHKTNHLTINAGLNGSWNLIWDGYQGFSFGSYRIYRGVDSLNLQFLTQIQSTLTSYTDLNPPSGNLYYQIEVVSPHACYPDSIITKAQTNYNTSRSNKTSTAAAPNIGIVEARKTSSIHLYPNPNDGSFVIESEYFGQNQMDMILYNSIGQVLFIETYPSGLPKTTKLDFRHLAKGLYFIKINEADGQIFNQKIIIR
jgi:PKD repeat protein